MLGRSCKITYFLFDLITASLVANEREIVNLNNLILKNAINIYILIINLAPCERNFLYATKFRHICRESY